MVESGDGPPPGNGAPQNSTRVLAIAAAVAAVAAFAVAIGLMIGTGDDPENTPASTTTTAPVASVTVPRTTVTTPSPSEAGRFSAPNTSPLPTGPVHQVGEGCSEGGAPGRWDVVTGRGWVCVPTAAAPTPSAPASPGGG